MGSFDSKRSKCVLRVCQVPKLSLTPLPLIGVPGTMENREDSNYRSIEFVENGIRKSSYDRPAIIFINLGIHSWIPRKSMHTCFKTTQEFFP